MELLYERGVTVLVAPLERGTDSVMRKPVLMAVDPDKILEAGAQARFAMRFELWKVDNSVSLEDSPGYQILMHRGVMVLEHLTAVVVGNSEKVTLRVKRLQQTPVAQVNGNIAERVSV